MSEVETDIYDQKQLGSISLLKKLAGQECKNPPFNRIGLILAVNGSNLHLSTGFLIAKDLVLTSAHPLFNIQKQKLTKSLPLSFVLPADGGQRGNCNFINITKYKFCEKYESNIKKRLYLLEEKHRIIRQESLQGWQLRCELDRKTQQDKQLIRENKPYDYAILKLETAVERQKYFKLEIPSQNNPELVTICGAKMQLKQSNLFLQYHSGALIIQDGLGFYDIDTMNGHSGSAIFSQTDESKVFGIHKGYQKEKNQNYCCLVNDEMIKQVQMWQNQPSKLNDIYLFQADKQNVQQVLLDQQIKQLTQSYKSWLKNKAELEKRKKREIKIQNFNNLLYKKPTMNIRCLGCTPYFIKNWNLQDQSINKVKFVLGGDIFNLLSKKSTWAEKRTAEIKITDQICGFLNTGGGIILFGCDQTSTSIAPKRQKSPQDQAKQTSTNLVSGAEQVQISTNVVPRGQQLALDQVNFIQEIFEKNILSQISPKPKLSENIVFNLVKVMKDLLEQQEDYQLLETSQMFYKRLYIARIIVRPTVNASYVVENDNQTYKVLRTKSVSDQYIQRINVDVKQIEKGSQLTHEQSLMLGEPYSQFEHQECLSSSYSFGINQLLSTRIETIDQSSDPQKMYKYATAFICQSKNYNRFRDIRNKIGQKHFFEYPYSDKKVDIVAILYHDLDKKQKSKMIAEIKTFEFRGIKTETFEIASHIKLSKRLNQIEFTDLQTKMDLIFKKDQKCVLQMHKFVNQQKKVDYYLSVSGKKAVKKCTMYIYQLARLLQDSSQMVNPDNMEKLQIDNFQEEWSEIE